MSDLHPLFEEILRPMPPIPCVYPTWIGVQMKNGIDGKSVEGHEFAASNIASHSAGCAFIVTDESNGQKYEVVVNVVKP